jgi:hypothetical protein
VEILVRKAHYDQIAQTLAAEQQSSQYTYGFPNGDGDCNCVTWIERIGVPVVTGRIVELLGLMSNMPKRLWKL